MDSIDTMSTYELVIRLPLHIETVLTESFGVEGRGLYEKSAMITGLGPEIRRHILSISCMRNRFIHSGIDFNRQSFVNSFKIVVGRLDKLKNVMRSGEFQNRKAATGMNESKLAELMRREALNAKVLDLNGFIEIEDEEVKELNVGIIHRPERYTLQQ